MTEPAAPAPRARVVLLEPKRGANVGAVCRAMRNMGGAGLYIVRGRYDRDEAQRTAVHGVDVFHGRREVDTFDDAIDGASIVIGTTSRRSPWHLPVAPVREVVEACVRELRPRTGEGGEGRQAGEAAIVFGTEERGLSNAEASRCHRLAYVPTAGDYASLNLSQAAVVCLYEWMMAGRAHAGIGNAKGLGNDATTADEHATAGLVSSAGGDAGNAKAGDGTAGIDRAAPADAATVAAALQDFGGMLAEIGFLAGDQSARVMATVASMLSRAGLDDREVRIVRGIARQVRWFARRGNDRSS